jgi:hypothetical protein
MGGAIQITERGYRESCLGRVLQLKVFDAAYRPLSWREVWEAFAARYPGRWAVQCFPPAGQLVDGKAVYHLWVLEEGRTPVGLNLRG